MLKIDRDWRAIGNDQDVLGRFMFMQYARYIWNDNKVVARVVSGLQYFELQQPQPGCFSTVSKHTTMDLAWKTFQELYSAGLWNAAAAENDAGPHHNDPASALPSADAARPASSGI